MKRLLIAMVVVLLASGAARAGKVETDFNPKADFAAYHTWDWVPDHDVGHRGILAGPAARDLVEEALRGHLARAGIRRVTAGETPDLVVRYWGDVSDATTGTAVGFMGGYDPYLTQVPFSERSATLIVDLIDPATKVLVWRVYIEQKTGTVNETGSPVADALRKAFEKYPPSESARARKLKEWEKRGAAK